jgi:hypothetical protein
MKKYAFVAVLVCLLVPGLTFGDGDGSKWKRIEDKDKDKDDIRATEMLTAGFATAGLIGVAGYFFQRRRSARN